MFKGSAVSVTQLEAGIAELNFDLAGHSVNKFNALTIGELSEALDALESASDLKGVIVTSGKGVFVVGADITEFGSMFGVPDFNKAEDLNNTNLNRLETLSVPVVVAINGYALGGGLEVCLACDFRVMSTAAKVGLPETKLGLIPGWG